MELPSVYVKDELPVSTYFKAKMADASQWEHLRDIELPELSTDQVGLLIGQDAPEVLLPTEVRRGEVGSPVAIRTVFGWTVGGPSGCRTGRVTSHFVVGDIKEQIETFWKSEATPLPRDSECGASFSVDDLRALRIWNDSITMDEGHYCLDIPFKNYPPQMPNNVVVARQRIESLKRRLSRDQDLARAYSQNMNELINKGYAEPAPEASDSSRDGVWYLPHHPIFNENKSGKVRIVFDCAATHQGVSLNSVVLQGQMTNALIGVLLRFRLEKVAIMTDIETYVLPGEGE